MRHYIIDGNNLIGKIKRLFQVQQKDGQSSREKLAFIIDNYFYNKRVKISLCFDGYPQIAIRTSNIKIYYSEKKTADDVIKTLIEQSKNPKLLVVISSDHNLIEFARVCHCGVMTSEDFSRELTSRNKSDDEEEKKNAISNDEMKRLFGL